MQPSTLLAAVAPTASKHSAPHLRAVGLLAAIDEMGGGRVDVWWEVVSTQRHNMHIQLATCTTRKYHNLNTHHPTHGLTARH
jgi:hypothetical protein